jgi:hypothetical protein
MAPEPARQNARAADTATQKHEPSGGKHVDSKISRKY